MTKLLKRSGLLLRTASGISFEEIEFNIKKDRVIPGYLDPKVKQKAIYDENKKNDNLNDCILPGCRVYKGTGV